MTGTDDAPVWAEVCALVLVLGNLLRWCIHVFAAGEFVAEIEWPGQLEALDSPVPEIRGTRIAIGSSVVSVMTGASLWLMTPSVASAGILAAWVKLQAVPLLCDPVALAIAQKRDQTEDNEIDPVI